MKTFLKIIAVCGFILLISFACHYETHYHRMGIITNIEDSVVTVECGDGNIWEFEGEGYKLGDEVMLTFFTNHTDENIEDDRLIDAKVIEG